MKRLTIINHDYVTTRLFHLLGLVGAGVLLMSCAEQEVMDSEVISNEVRSMVTAHWAAINDGETDTVNSHHADGFTAIMPDFATQFVEGSPEFDELVATESSWQPGEIHVQPLSKSSAVATFLMDGSITWPDETVDSRTRRVTEVWVRKGETWKEVHHHDSVYAPRESTARDVKAVKELVNRAVEANNTGDTEGFLRLFTDDAIIMPDGAATIADPASLRSATEARFAALSYDILIDPVEIEVFRDTAIVRTRLTGTFTPKEDGEPAPFNGREMAVLKRGPDGEWKVWRLIGSPDPGV